MAAPPRQRCASLRGRSAPLKQIPDALFDLSSPQASVVGPGRRQRWSTHRGERTRCRALGRSLLGKLAGEDVERLPVKAVRRLAAKGDPRIVVAPAPLPVPDPPTPVLPPDVSFAPRSCEPSKWGTSGGNFISAPGRP